jgi:tripartite-type tricarboxylate transporter receptor subunit TctC
MNRTLIAVLAVLAAAGAGSGSTPAQAYPDKPVRIVIPFAAGGGPDVQARQFGQKLAEVMRQPAIMENKVGAAGALAAQYVAQAAPDGYTLLLGTSTPLVQKRLNPELKFDPIADFAPITNMASSPAVLVVRAEHPARNARDLIALGKANPGKLNYGSGGIGTAAHLAGATFEALGGFKAVHIPLKGSVEIQSSLLRGDTDFAFPISSTAIPAVRTGKLRALGVTSARRLASLPEVPTMHEQFKDELYVQESWLAIWAPVKTPPEVLRAFHGLAVKALADAALAKAFEATGAIVETSESPAAAAAFWKREDDKWGRIVKLSGAKAN